MKWGILFCLGLILVSCTSRPVSPTRESRRAIDTIYREKILMLQPKVDSLCTFLRDSIYAVAVDSILNERQDQMNALIK